MATRIHVSDIRIAFDRVTGRVVHSCNATFTPEVGPIHTRYDCTLHYIVSLTHGQNACVISNAEEVLCHVIENLMC